MPQLRKPSGPSVIFRLSSIACIVGSRWLGTNRVMHLPGTCPTSNLPIRSAGPIARGRNPDRDGSRKARPLLVRVVIPKKSPRPHRPSAGTSFGRLRRLRPPPESFDLPNFGEFPSYLPTSSTMRPALEAGVPFGSSRVHRQLLQRALLRVTFTTFFVFGSFVYTRTSISVGGWALPSPLRTKIPFSRIAARRRYEQALLVQTFTLMSRSSVARPFCSAVILSSACSLFVPSCCGSSPASVRVSAALFPSSGLQIGSQPPCGCPCRTRP